MDILKTYHNCLVDPKKQFIFFPVPKCASQKFYGIFHNAKWTQLKDTTVIDYHRLFANAYKFAILRDPLQRWVSGFVTFLSLDELSSDYNKPMNKLLLSEYWSEALSIIFEYAPLDFGHYCKLQKDFFSHYVNEQFPINEITFFSMDDKLGYTVGKWLQSNDNFITIDNTKVNILNKQLQIYKAITEFLFDAKNDRYKQKLYDYLRPDYEFINSIKFYAR